MKCLSFVQSLVLGLPDASGPSWVDSAIGAWQAEGQECAPSTEHAQGGSVFWLMWRGATQKFDSHCNSRNLPLRYGHRSTAPTARILPDEPFGRELDDAALQRIRSVLGDPFKFMGACHFYSDGVMQADTTEPFNTGREG